MTGWDFVYARVDAHEGPIHTYRVSDHARMRKTRAVVANELQPLLAWCQAEFGAPRRTPWGEPGSRWYFSGKRLSFGFFHEEDAFSFKLRWC